MRSQKITIEEVKLMDYTRRNWAALGISLAAAIVVIALLTVFIGGTSAGNMLIGATSSPVYPFSLHNLMHLFFFIGLGQLWVRWLSTYEENVFLKKSGFLPEEEGAILGSDESIESIRVNVSNAAGRAEAFLPDLINTCIIQYFKSHSVSDTIAVLNSNLELNIHRLDLRYSLSRYIVWAIPTFGFIGTVVGISDALGELDINKFMGAHADKVVQFKALTADLGFAFSTTIVALALSAILVFLLNVVQKGEEEALNRSGKYVLTNLINRLHVNNRK
ncbi:MAG TPA: MotA/TolQ/ExbB proton channel family protein [Spirochaetota bacterium]|nr:MotA/TolQ/ExbB proton channel family protein [Spirochaetota bacterium]